MKIQENVPLSGLTTFRTGGPARFLVLIESKDEVPEAARFAEEKGLPLIPIGGGSNLLPPDAGLEAVVVRYLPSEIREEPEGARTRVIADAGCEWDALVAYAVGRGLWGIENLSSIPGTAGAAAVQNIGAYGAALSDTLESVEAYDMLEKRFVTLSKEECGLGYRMSIFKKETDRYLITSVSLLLSKTGEANTTYRDLTVYFEKRPVTKTLGNMRKAVEEIRAGKFPPLAEYGTAGSFFLNPIFTPESVLRISGQYPQMPTYKLPEGGVKIPLAWIFDQVMRAKGRSEGGAFIWDKQPLVIASEEGASTNDVIRLAQSIVKDFFSHTGIKISPEVRLFGEDKKKFE